MIYNEFPIPLPFYDSIELQDRYKENAGNTGFGLIAQSDKALPFQFRTDEDVNLISLQLFDSENNLVYVIDKNDLVIDLLSGWKYFTWLGSQPLKILSNGENLNLPCNQYYFKSNLSDGSSLVSELFRTINNINDYLVLEWSDNTGAIDPVYYGNGYRNRLICDTFLTKGIPSIEIETKDNGFNNQIPITRKMINNYDFSLGIVPNFIIDAINFMAIHDNIDVKTKENKRKGKIINVTVEQDQIETSAIWELTVKFNIEVFFWANACKNEIEPKPIPDEIIIFTGSPAQSFELIYDAN